MNYPRPVVMAMSIMVGIKTLLAAAAVTTLIGAQVTGIILAVILAVEVGVAFYVQGQVVPLSHTIAYEDAQALARAGGAAGVATNRLVNTDSTVTELLEDRERGTPGG